MSEREQLTEDMFRQYGVAIYVKCKRMLRDHHQAEDAVQETFMRAYGAIDRLRRDSHHMGWLYSIATNVCLNMLRTRRRKGLLLEPDMGEVGKADVPQAASRLHARRALQRLLDEVDERNLQILALHFIDGLDQGQVADALGISRRSVVKRLAQLRARMKTLEEGP